MAGEFAPALCVVPIVGLHADGSLGRFLGSGFFTTDRNILLTCAHVIAKWDGPRFGCIPQLGEHRIFNATVVKSDRSVDLASLSVPDSTPPHSFPLSNVGDVFLNETVCTFEYGATDIVGTHINFSGSNRLGNINRQRTLREQFGKAGERMLELSNPALHGASGAPGVRSVYPHEVWGVITANVARELLPVQIEQVIDEHGRLEEETRFLLPYALAIHVMHVREFLEPKQPLHPDALTCASECRR